jgi:hypothetical protein
MKKKLLSAILAAALCLGSLAAESRSENIDVIVLLDTSYSMSNLIGNGPATRIGNAEDYIARRVIDYILIPGDSFTLINFYWEAKVEYSAPFKSEADRAALMSLVRGYKADKPYTDISNALDTLGTVLNKLGNDGKKKYILLLTDEVQDVPPNWKYYSPDKKSHHYLLKYVRKMDEGDWKVITIGLDTAGDIEKESGRLIQTLLDVKPRDGVEPLGGSVLSEADAKAKASSSAAASASASASSGAQASADSSGLLFLILGVGGGLILVAAIIVILLVAKKKRDEKRRKPKIQLGS